MSRGKIIFYSVLGLVVIGGGIFMYKKFFATPLEQPEGEIGSKSTSSKKAVAKIASGTSIKAKLDATPIFDATTLKKVRLAKKGDVLGIVNNLTVGGQYKFTDVSGNKFFVSGNNIEKA